MNAPMRKKTIPRYTVGKLERRILPATTIIEPPIVITMPTQTSSLTIQSPSKLEIRYFRFYLKISRGCQRLRNRLLAVDTEKPRYSAICECEGWDSNPRTSTGQGPQPCAVDQAWLPSRMYAEGEIFKPLIQGFLNSRGAKHHRLSWGYLSRPAP